MEFRLSTKAGSAGDSTASTAAGSLGKYMSTRVIVDGALGNLFRPATGLEATAGHTDYRCLFVLNEHATDAQDNVKVWIGSQVVGGADIAIGLDPAGVTAEDSSSAQAAEIATEAVAPTGVTFSTPTTIGVGLNTGTVQAGECFAVWIRRRVPAGAFANSADGALILVGGEET